MNPLLCSRSPSLGSVEELLLSGQMTTSSGQMTTPMRLAHVASSFIMPNSCCLFFALEITKSVPQVVQPPSGPPRSPHLPHRHPPPWWGLENRFRLVSDHLPEKGMKRGIPLRCIREMLRAQRCAVCGGGAQEDRSVRSSADIGGGIQG